ncbi:hypothetical protein H0N96_03155 [Candidatus Micrarchaeota archaeon]|nr:hypothetical protein [Candidatus Micrarchaeota archaeon]
MAIKLTPIESELIFEHLPVSKEEFEKLPEKERKKWFEEREKWRSEVEKVDGESRRVELSRMLHRVLDQKLGSHLQGIIEKKDAFERLGTLFTIASLPEEIPLKKSEKDIKNIMAAADHGKALHERLLPFLKKIIPLEKTKLQDEALENSEYLSNLFKYHAGYKDDKNRLEVFQMIHKAFLEDGVKGVKKVKYHSEHFKEALKDEKTRKFAEDLDGLLGEVTAGGGRKFDLHEVFKGKLEDFEAHSKQEKLDEALAEAERKAQATAGELKKALSDVGDDALSKRVEKLVAKRDFEALREEAEGLKKKQAAGKKEKIRSFAIGALSRMASLGKQEDMRKAIHAGKEIAAELEKLEGKPLGKQYESLSELERKFGRGNLEKHEKALAALGKASFLDLSYFIKQVLEPPQKSAGETVTARIVHDADLLFTLGKFENNCQSPGVTHSQSLLGFAIHPSELTIGFFNEEGEFIGFSFAHFMQHGDGHAVAIERPYSNHGGLKPAMEELRKQIAGKIEVLAQKRGLKIKAFPSNEKPSGLKTLPSPYVSKWYDIKSGEVSGGEQIG